MAFDKSKLPSEAKVVTPEKISLARIRTSATAAVTSPAIVII
ncbi:hypothetical protein SGADD02_00413 [Streptococcus gallolyticus]|uniref:Uncharacterized protein n=1 Tax=Streptococcus gallolyticus TaxID=315405 RepID=A0A139NAV1_9STRE|nr:hypothetical protein SGADD02_00413 [Streptococcus gallolyticus]